MAEDGVPMKLFSPAARMLLWSSGPHVRVAELEAAIKREEDRNDRRERNLRSENLAFVQRDRFENQILRSEQAIAELRQFTGGGIAYGSPYGGAVSYDALDEYGLARCRAGSCNELLDEAARFERMGYCTRHWALATGRPDPDAWISERSD